MRSYIEEQSSPVFGNTLCLIYVFDIHKKPSETDLMYYEMTLEALRTHSPDAKVYTLLHKTDLLPAHPAPQTTTKNRRIEIEKRAIPTLTLTFATSIWDESLFKAWSSIVHALLSGVARLEQQMAAFIEKVNADEFVLYEPNTLLVMAQSIRHHHHDHHRFEKISSIVKQFRFACQNKKLTPARMLMRTAGLEENHRGMVLFIEKVSDGAVVLITGRQGQLSEQKLTTDSIAAAIQ